MNANAQTQSFDSSEYNALIVAHMDMARRIALRVGRRLPDWLTQDDIVAAAMVGLSEAAVRFNATRGESFVAFAEKRIRGAVFDELRRGDILPRRVRTMARKVTATTKELEQKLGRSPIDAEVAEALGVSIEEYRERLEGLGQVSVVSLDINAEQNHEPADTRTSIEEVTEKNLLLQKIKDSLHRLQPRDATILSLYYMEELSYVEIGSVLGVSESRVCQLHARAIARLRAEFEAAPKL
jgi:RNA polymerase sigma factor for flagellar operon FliA